MSRRGNCSSSCPINSEMNADELLIGWADRAE